MWRWIAAIAWTMWLGCSVPDVELDEKACPCVEETGYFCDTDRDACESRIPDSTPLLDESFEALPGALDARETDVGRAWRVVAGEGMVDAGAAINTNAPFTAFIDIGATLVRIEADMTLPPRAPTEQWMAGIVAAAWESGVPDIVDGLVVRVDHNDGSFTIRIQDWKGRSFRSGRVRHIFDVLDASGGAIRLVQIVATHGVVAYIDGRFEDSVVVLPLNEPPTGTNVGITVNDAGGAVGTRWESLRVFRNVEDTTPPTIVENVRLSGTILEWDEATDNLGVWGYQLSRRTLTGSGFEGPTFAPDTTSFMPGADGAIDPGYWPGEETEVYVLAFDVAGNVINSETFGYMP